MNETGKNEGVRFLLDVPVHAVDLAAAAGMIAEWILRRQRPPAFVVQANSLSLVTAREDPDYREAIGNANLVVADGMPLVWLFRMKGAGVRERVYGPDLMLTLCGIASEKGWRCFLYGGKEGTPELLKEKLTARFPGLTIVGTYSPPFRPLSSEEDAKVCATINSARPDILWVGLGGPKQDLWMYHHRNAIDVPVMHGVGAAFDFLSGQVRQAPRWMMNMGLEWFFRLLVEPGRLWRRYTVKNLKFLYYLVTRELFHR